MNNGLYTSWAAGLASEASLNEGVLDTLPLVLGDDTLQLGGLGVPRFVRRRAASRMELETLVALAKARGLCNDDGEDATLLLAIVIVLLKYVFWVLWRKVES